MILIILISDEPIYFFKLEKILKIYYVISIHLIEEMLTTTNNMMVFWEDLTLVS